MSETDTAQDIEAATDPVLAAPAAAAPPSDTATPPPQRRRRGGAGFLALLLGGALAAVGGFALARFVPDGWPLADPPGLTVAQQALADQQAILDDLQARLVALEAAPAAADPGPMLQELQARIGTLEARPEVADTEGLATLKAEVETLRAVVTAPTAQMQAEAEARLADAKAQADALRADAEADAAAARRSAALAAVRAAFDAGLPMQSALAALASENVMVPAELAGDIPSLPALQASFAPTARQALAEARLADPGQDLASRLTSFLAAQTGARSLSPKEGDGADAVLSRAEAALATADLDAALSELQALPPAALPAMEPWLAEARRRQAAAAALAQLN